MQVITNLGIEHNVGATATALNGASLFRVYNSSGSDASMLLVDGSANTLACMTIKDGDTVFVSKNPSDLVKFDKTVKVVSVGYSH